METNRSTTRVRRNHGRVTALSFMVLAIMGMISACAEEPPPSPQVEGTLLNPVDENGHGDRSVLRAATSADGQVLAYSVGVDGSTMADLYGPAEIRVHDRQSGVVTTIAQDVRIDVRITPNGRFVSYSSWIDLGNGQSGTDMAVHDRDTGWTKHWQTTTATEAPVVSPDGATAVFGATTTPILDACGIVELGSWDSDDIDGETACPLEPGVDPQSAHRGLVSTSADLRFVLYAVRNAAGDPIPGNFRMLDRQDGSVRVLDLPGPDVLQQAIGIGDHRISDDGTRIAAGGMDLSTFSLVTTLVDISGDQPTFTSLPVSSIGNRSNWPSAISGDGRYVSMWTQPVGDSGVGGPNLGVRAYRWDTLTNTKVAFKTSPEGGSFGLSLPCGGVPFTADGTGFCVVGTPAGGNVSGNAWLIES